MQVEVKNMKGEKVKTVDLPAAIFEAPINKDLMHQALVRQQANARLGTHDTKGRSEVAGGGKKPWKQKHTGRARQGSTRAPQWRKGAVIFGPQPRDWSYNIPKKVRRQALKSALSLKHRDGNILILKDLNLPRVKTKEVVNFLKRFE